MIAVENLRVQFDENVTIVQEKFLYFSFPLEVDFNKNVKFKEEFFGKKIINIFADIFRKLM